MNADPGERRSAERRAVPARRPAPPVVLVDDDLPTLEAFGLFLKSAKIRDFRAFDDPREVLPFVAEHGASLIVLDLMMPLLSGADLLRELRSTLSTEIPVIVVTGDQEVETAVRCMKEGAFDYLVKPVEKSRFTAAVSKALEIVSLRREVAALKTTLLAGVPRNRAAFANFVTRSPRVLAILSYVESVAVSRQPLLITGETGVGKEIVARAAHEASGCAGPFVAVNVAGLDDALFSDTLFGHARGAYTGAEKSRGGIVAQAAGGTLFLDEIGELGEPSQVRLLRLIQEHAYYPLGSDTLKPSDARIVAATNKSLEELARGGHFRKDLYFRLATHHVHIPPLRERREDLPPLIDHFLEAAAVAMNLKKPAVPDELLLLLHTYPFPGNVRELQAMIYDAVARPHAAILSLRSFKEALRRMAPGTRAAAPGATDARFPTLREAEDSLVAEALRRAQGNQSLAASLLGISRQALSKRLKKGQGKPGEDP